MVAIEVGDKMDLKVLQKSNTFSSLSNGSQMLGSWFDRRAKKLSMKCSKSITLGEQVLFLASYERNNLISYAILHVVLHFEFLFVVNNIDFD